MTHRLGIFLLDGKSSNILPMQRSRYKKKIVQIYPIDDIPSYNMIAYSTYSQLVYTGMC